jgi:hypothetical protein
MVNTQTTVHTPDHYVARCAPHDDRGREWRRTAHLMMTMEGKCHPPHDVNGEKLRPHDDNE